MNENVACNSLTIYTISGKRIFTEKHENINLITQNVAMLSSGLYIGSLLINGNYTNFKFLISK